MKQTNGWTFWKYRAADGEHEMDQLRRQLWERRR